MHKAPEHISSLQNGRIKNLVLLQDKSSERREQKRFVIEGRKEIDMALQHGFIIESCFLSIDAEIPESIEKSGSNRIFTVSNEVMRKIAYREGTTEMVAVAVSKELRLQEVKLSSNPLIIVLESVEKPGNLGAILRTADAVNADALLICEPKADLYNPNVIRSSVGTLFGRQVIACTNQEALEWLRKNKIRTYSAALTAKHFYHEAPLDKSCALIFGTEATGLSEFWLKECDEEIKIPMMGDNDSLNVSASVAVLAYEARRQRDFK